VLRQRNHDEPTSDQCAQAGRLDLLHQVRIAPQEQAKAETEEDRGVIYNGAELARTWRKEMTNDEPRKLWIGRWLFHSLWSRDGAWTVTKGNECYSLWLYFGPLDRPEGRAWILTLWRWKLIFARA
jgi:hypothetical protein